MGQQIYPEPAQAKKNSAWRNFAILCLACSLVPIVVMMCSQISGPVGPTIPKVIPARYVAKPDAQLDAMTLKEHMTVIRAVAAKGDEASDDEMLDAIDHARAARKTSPNNKELFRLKEGILNRLTHRGLHEASEKIRTQSTGDAAWIYCKLYVQQNLKSPSSADFLSPGAHDIRSWRDHNFMWLTDVTVDAQNSFGAKLRSSYECQVQCLTTESCEVTKLKQIR